MAFPPSLCATFDREQRTKGAALDLQWPANILQHWQDFHAHFHSPHDEHEAVPGECREMRMMIQ